MSTLFILLFFIITLVFIVGMIKPSLLERIYKDRSNRKFIASTLLPLMLVCALVGGATTDVQPPQTDSNKVSQQAQSEQVESFSGSYDKYEYTALYKDSDSRYVATFTPALARDDATVIGAMKELAIKTYDDPAVENSETTIDERDGGNVLKLKGNDTYSFLLIKNDDGTTHSIAYTIDG